MKVSMSAGLWPHVRRGGIGLFVGGFSGAVCQGSWSGLLTWLGELEEQAKWIVIETILGTLNGAINGGVLGLMVGLGIHVWRGRDGEGMY